MKKLRKPLNFQTWNRRNQNKKFQNLYYWIFVQIYELSKIIKEFIKIQDNYHKLQSKSFIFPIISVKSEHLLKSHYIYLIYNDLFKFIENLILILI